MQRNRELEHKACEKALHNLFTILKILHKEAKNKVLHHYNREALANTSYNFNLMMGEVRHNYITSIRTMIKKLQGKDYLKYRSGFIGTNQKPCAKFVQNTDDGSINWRFESDMFWPDDFVKAMYNGFSPKNKHNFFRIDDGFFSKDEYICFKGTPYEKSKYAIDEKGELVELSKCLKLQSDFNSSYMNSSFQTAFWMKSQEEEEFECVDFPQGDEYIVRIICYEHVSVPAYFNMLLDKNYFYTLFKFGKKRYFYKNNNSREFRLTADMLKNLEYSPTEEHKRIWRDLYEKTMCYRKRNGNNTLPRIEEDGNNVMFRIYYNTDVVKTSSIKDKVIRAVCDDNNESKLSTGGLVKRLMALKELYQTEDKYDTKRNK